MGEKKLNELYKAKAVICSYCSSDMCEWCQVERIVSDAEIEFANDDDEYMRSSTNGDYSPSTPWNAPGMSVSDFI